MSFILRRRLSACVRLLQDGPERNNRFATLYSNKSSGSSDNQKRPTKTYSNNNNNNNNTTATNNKNHNNHNNRSPYPPRNNAQRQGYGTRRHQGPIHPSKVRLTNASDTKASAIKHIIKQVGELSPSFEVEQITDRGLVPMHLSDIIKGLDLDQDGIKLRERLGSDGVPLIQVVPVREMTAEFRKYLNTVREQELVAMGNPKMLKTMELRQKRMKKLSEYKEVEIRWGISVRDLREQKKKEIQRIFASDKKKQFYITLLHFKMPDDPWANEREKRKDPEQYALKVKRNKAVQLIVEEEILNELNCRWTVEGDPEMRLMYTVSKKDPTPEELEAEKQAAAEKEAKKKKKKQPKQTKAKQNLSEESLDDLYLFKIED
ncbi:Altered inheritance of mitochondria protein 23, mitochondrial [Candida viswanathii]|uniref:Altered inheritance of mitochondria protein 23, mitochondrial n=1 Tax=Candida viswanathii TaxID=5486 RepID=A0A367XX98_9ASCO|nr:Altered inheritance of mitochondria protein 23, mitochondrial [Candida viswanathii]